jgi:hypothetical protein
MILFLFFYQLVKCNGLRRRKIWPTDFCRTYAGQERRWLEEGESLLTRGLARTGGETPQQEEAEEGQFIFPSWTPRRLRAAGYLSHGDDGDADATGGLDWEEESTPAATQNRVAW